MRPRTVRIITSPTAEPVTLEEIRAHLGIADAVDDHDSMLVAASATARRLIETRLGVTLAPTQYRAKWNAGARVLELPNPPVLVDAEHPLAVTVGEAGVDDGTYSIDADAMPAVLTLPAAAAADVVVTYWAGGETISPQLRSAVLLYVGHLYANREATSENPVGEVPLAFEALLASESISGVY